MRLFAGASCWVAGAATAAAHDYWLEPAPTLATRGEELVVHLEMGDRLKLDEERPLQKEHVERFDLFGDRTARRDLLAASKDGQIPAARVKLESGSALVVMDRLPRPITEPADKFNAYLATEGLDLAAGLRARFGQSEAPAREMYSRYLKALIQERDPNLETASTLYRRRVGQKLEVLLETDPAQLKPDHRLLAKVLFDEEPLAGARVFACRRGGANDQSPVVVPGTTSSKGIAEFRLDQPGLWMVRLVHMRPAAGARNESETTWESFWAAYTFEARLAPISVHVPATAASASPAPSATASAKE